MRRLCFLCAVLGMSFLYSGESITGNDQAYLGICRKAVVDDYYFQNFRSIPEYSHAVELPGGHPFADYLTRNPSPELLSKSETFRKLDQIGSPETTSFPLLGSFSGTTLRYIAIADHIQKLFQLPENPKVVEIGAGFGGQSYVLSQVLNISKYYIYDLPEVEALIEMVVSCLEMDHVALLPLETALPEAEVDLFISNYAYSECDRQTQIEYFERVMKKAVRGYVIYNQIARRIFGINSLKPNELVKLLEKNHMNPKVHSELIPTANDNVLITWDKTQ